MVKRKYHYEVTQEILPNVVIQRALARNLKEALYLKKRIHGTHIYKALGEVEHQHWTSARVKR